MLGRDLVAPESCGVVNPLTGMVNTAAQSAQMGQEVRAMAGRPGMQKPGLGMPMQGGPQVDMMMGQQMMGNHSVRDAHAMILTHPSPPNPVTTHPVSALLFLPWDAQLLPPLLSH